MSSLPAGVATTRETYVAQTFNLAANELDQALFDLRRAYRRGEMSREDYLAVCATATEGAGARMARADAVAAGRAREGS